MVQPHEKNCKNKDMKSSILAIKAAIILPTYPQKKDEKEPSKQYISVIRTESTASISNAGVGPTVPAATLFSLNYFAATELAEGLQPLLKKKRGNCVMTASNSITFPYVREDWVDMLTNIHDEDSFTQIAQGIPPQAGPACYSTSKHALTRWMRRVSPSWAVEGTRINAVAPGNTTTPMTQNMTPEQKEAALLIPIPTRYGKKEFLDAEEIANGIIFLSSPMASGVNGNHFICGRRNRRTVAF